jgi:hypothetical protein
VLDLKLDEPKHIARSIVGNVTCYKTEAIHEALGAALQGGEEEPHGGSKSQE